MSGQTSEQRSERPWSVPVAVADIPDTGRRIDLTADDATRLAVAKVAGVAALPRLEASFELMRQGHDGLRVAGRVVASVTQHCVVTLEPIESEIDENVDVVFAPQADAVPEKTAGSVLNAADAEEPPEPLRDGTVDLGALAIEFLILGIDPYPRKPGVVFAAPPAGDPASHPFAALAALKKGATSEEP
jgi:uncharacterized metal-binding protein YceD (DUF177 family)